MSNKALKLFFAITGRHVPLAKEIYFLLGLGLVLFYYAAVVSYHPWDPSVFSFSTPAPHVKNLAGSIGASLGAWFFFHVGLASYLIPMPVLVSMLHMLRGKERLWKSFRLPGCMLLISSFVALLHWLKPEFQIAGLNALSGGGLGRWFFEETYPRLGKFGYPLLTGIACLTGLTMVFGLSYARLIRATIAFSRERLSWPSFNWNILRFWRNQYKVESKVPEGNLAPTAFESEPVLEELGPEDLDEEDEQELFPNLQRQEPRISPKRPPKAWDKNYQKNLDTSMFKSPPMQGGLNQKELTNTAQLIVQVFDEFGIKGDVIGMQPGPVVTVYEFQPDAGVKQAKILALIDDIALALKVDSIFIFPVKGKRALGIQVPNQTRRLAYIKEILESQSFQDTPSPLTMAMGLSISGEPICADLRSMPHLLMAGATGAGKSVAINTMLISIIAKSDPSSVKMILVDPKMLELSVYEGIPHLLMPVITDANRAAMALKWAVNEMERRYKIMQQLSVRNIAGFNELWPILPESERERLRELAQDPDLDGLPIILVVIDELADLMLTAPKDVENCIQRLAQKARASGIHMILATQRPSVDIITGVIKANLPCRIAFQVVSRHDSRTILDQMGAEKLLGKGDMLFMRPGSQRLDRIQGAMIEDQEVNAFINQFKVTEGKTYDENLIEWIEQEIHKNTSSDSSDEELANDDDPKWDEALSIAESQGTISASFLQRRLKIGYNRAARLVEKMEAMGLVERGSGSKQRAWLGR